MPIAQDEQAREMSNLRWVLLGATEHVGFRAVRKAELVHHDVRTERDEADQGGLGDEVQGLLQRILELLHFLLVDARVNDEQEEGRTRRWRRLEFVLDGGELGAQLRWQVRFPDILRIVRREVVPGQAERASPQFRPVIHLAAGSARAGGGLSKGARRRETSGRPAGSGRQTAAGNLVQVRIRKKRTSKG